MSTEAQPDTWSADLYNANAHFVYSPQYTSAVLTKLNAQPGEKILDLGCGSGEITLELEKAVGESGIAVGTDFSESMIKKCGENGVQHAFVADAQALAFPNQLKHLEGHFDAVFSNATLHWCKNDPAGAIKSVKRALKKDGTGRFVAEFGGYLNCVGVRSALRSVLKARGRDVDGLDPWFFPSIEQYGALLEQEGFKVADISLNPRLTPLPGSVVDWLRTFCRESWLHGMGDTEAEEILNEVAESYRVDGYDPYTKKWALMYVRLRFVAILPVA